MLDLLHELGVIHLVNKSKMNRGPGGNNYTAKTAKASLPKTSQPRGEVTNSSAFETAASTSSIKGVTDKGGSMDASNKSSQPHVHDDPNPIYCFGNSIPRMDVVLPCQILDKITEAGEEVLRMKQRIEILTKALRVTDNAAEAVGEKNRGNKAEAPGTMTDATTVATGNQPKPINKRKQQTVGKQKQASAILKQLFQLHPEIARDPVYAAALRMFKVDVGSKIDHHRMAVNNTPEMEKVINAGVNFNAGRFGLGKKRMSGISVASSGGGGGGTVGGGEGSAKKKRKKGRPPKNANNNSSDKLKSGSLAAEAPSVRVNAAWI